MKFGIDYFPDAHPDQVSARQYFDDVLDLAGYADELGYELVGHRLELYAVPRRGAAKPGRE